MMNSEEIISVYETVSEITDQMLTAAKSRDWERFTHLETSCAQHIRALQDDGTSSDAAPLNPQHKEKKVRLIQKILADDKQIRDIIDPWMAELAHLMKSNNTARKLSSAYGNNRMA
jgi:flagellar protein FliT